MHIHKAFILCMLEIVKTRAVQLNVMCTCISVTGVFGIDYHKNCLIIMGILRKETAGFHVACLWRHCQIGDVMKPSMLY